MQQPMIYQLCTLVQGQAGKSYSSVNLYNKYEYSQSLNKIFENTGNIVRCIDSITVSS